MESLISPQSRVLCKSQNSEFSTKRGITMTLKFSFILAVLLLVGCATPPQVKQLSVKQNDYFDAAILAVSLQSEALMLATEKLVVQAKQRIAVEEKANNQRFQTMMQESALSASDALETVNRLTKTSLQAEQSRKKLDDDLQAIKNKTLELGLFLKKMKEVNITLDSYIQSEKAGEAIVKDVMKHPSVSALLDSVNTLTPKVKNSFNEISSLLNGLN
jgi:hypothetical protein